MRDEEATRLLTALNRLGLGIVQSGPNTLGTLTIELMGPAEAFTRLLAAMSGEDELEWV